MEGKMIVILLTGVLFLSNFAQTAPADGESLVLLDNLAIKETHSIFFKSLQGKFYCKLQEFINVSNM